MDHSFSSFQTSAVEVAESSNLRNGQDPKREKRYIEEEAALAYDQAAFATRGPLVSLNFPLEKVAESLQKMKYSCKEGSSPAKAIKESHKMLKSSKRRQVNEEDIVVFEDLGSDLLDELLSENSYSE
ncbi:UNVERIFIED_CONTAM: Ethylene-responsive transcription factor 1B [Sesamum calycinum]|uniref:Ethylene-responsive transcription factor 1B n=1 Tax=Sesamum calycinum TaxID=2727403 RepID=A0AAW2LIB3_9LAMI